MNKRQIELLNFCGYKVDGNKILSEKKSAITLFFDNESKLFSVKVKAITFNPGDYDDFEAFNLSMEHLLGLVYELNHLEVQHEE